MCIPKSWIPYIPKARNQVYLVVCRCVLVCTYGFDASHVPELSRVLSSLGELQLDADTAGDSSMCRPWKLVGGTTTGVEYIIPGTTGTYIIQFRAKGYFLSVALSR
ncbi:hypothetical protein M0802_006594 [Mischocyttarus mexicanus]|nr:hypothetical protein M0802_006594 [Mischocyttarus mexicanus]